VIATVAAPGCGTMADVPAPPRTPTAAAVQRRMLLGLGALRGLTLAWSIVVVVIDARSGVLSPAAPAAVLLAALALWSATWTAAVERDAAWTAGPGIAIDLALAAAVIWVDEWLGGPERSQSLGSAWPLVAVLATGVAVGPWWGMAGGAALGAAGVGAALASGASSGRWLALCGSTVLYSGAGWVAGWVAAQLRRTAAVAAAAEARDEVARTLHDGVLQTLAVVQRRSDDPELVALARDQDRELRLFLRGNLAGTAAAAVDTSGPRPGVTDPDPSVEVTTALAPVLSRLRARHDIDVQLVVIDPGNARGRGAEALAAAVGEAVTNAARHSGAEVVWVSVDVGPSGGTQVVVHDEGVGFDPLVTPEGDGLTRSVRQRLAVVGGGVELRSAPGAGCDVTLWVP
jgi:signal transduction histidine kinase